MALGRWPLLLQMVCDLTNRGQRGSEGQWRGTGPMWVAQTGRNSKLQGVNSGIVFLDWSSGGRDSILPLCEEFLAAPLDPTPFLHVVKVLRRRSIASIYIKHVYIVDREPRKLLRLAPDHVGQ